MWLEKSKIDFIKNANIHIFKIIIRAKPLSKDLNECTKIWIQKCIVSNPLNTTQVHLKIQSTNRSMVNSRI